MKISMYKICFMNSFKPKIKKLLITSYVNITKYLIKYRYPSEICHKILNFSLFHVISENFVCKYLCKSPPDAYCITNM